MTSARNDDKNGKDVAPALPMVTSAAFAITDDDKECQRLVEGFRQAIAVRQTILGS